MNEKWMEVQLRKACGTGLSLHYELCSCSSENGDYFYNHLPKVRM